MVTLKELLELFGPKNIFKWLADLPRFYIRPSEFFKDLFRESFSTAAKRLSFYLTLVAILMFAFLDADIRVILKVLIAESAACLLTVALLLPSRFLVGWLLKRRISAGNLFYFVLTTKALTSPLQLVFYYLFHTTEQYEFWFIHASILALLFLFVMLYSNKVLYHTMRAIFLGSFVNLLVLNLLVVGITLVKFDAHSWKFENPLVIDRIYQEYESKVYSLDPLIYRFPKEKFSLKLFDQVDVHYSLKYDNIDSLAVNMPSTLGEDGRFKLAIVSFLATKDSVREQLAFERNRMSFDTLSSYVQAMFNDIENPIDTSYTFIKHQRTIVIQEDGREGGYIKTLTQNPALREAYQKYVRHHNGYIETTDIAEYPFAAIGLLFFPAVSILGDENI